MGPSDYCGLLNFMYEFAKPLILAGCRGTPARAAAWRPFVHLTGQRALLRREGGLKVDQSADSSAMMNLLPRCDKPAGLTPATAVAAVGMKADSKMHKSSVLALSL